MKNKHITGQLRLSYSAMKDTSCDQYEVHAAIEAHKLGLILYIDKHWYHGIISVNGIYGTPEEADVEDILTKDVASTSKALSDFLKAEAISKLSLRGEVLLQVEDTEAGKTSMARITVSEGQLSYQRTSYVWSESVAV